MQVKGRIVAVTGGANSIGKALCEIFAAAGAARVIVADLDLERALAVARAIDGEAFACDVAQEAQLRSLIEHVEQRIGSIDLFCSNAGIASGFSQADGSVVDVPDDVWMRAWQVNVMAHVHTARLLVPRMKARGHGYFLNTVSAAGLLSQVGSAVYSATKHAAVGFAESLAYEHRDDGIRVSILCPQGVDTAMLRGLPEGPQSRDGVMTADEVAACALRGVEEERFLILPHPAVAQYMQRKAASYDRWLAAMAKLRRQFKNRD